jgi:hypothetical protein
MKRTALLAAALFIGIPLSAAAQTDGPSCPEYEGVVCDGWVTDAAGVIADDTLLEQAVGRVVAKHGNEVAVVVVATSGSLSPRSFAEGLGNTWEVGDAERNDGIVVLISLAERRTEIVTGDGLSLAGLDDVAAAGNSFLAAGDIDGGVTAVLGALDARLGTPTTTPSPADDGGNGLHLWQIVLAVGLAGGGTLLIANGFSARRRRIAERRRQLVDEELRRLHPAGQELPHPGDFAREPPVPAGGIGTGRGLAALRGVIDRDAGTDTDALRELWALGALEVLDRDRLVEEHLIPLELAASDEGTMLENAVQQAARDALEIPAGRKDQFEVALAEVRRLVEALRPHRVAGARKRTAEMIADALSDTTIGTAGVTDLGERLHRAAAALETDAPLEGSVAELESAYATARDKTARLDDLYRRLPEHITRPAVAAALADLDADTDDSVARFEEIRRELEKRGRVLHNDGLQIPAIAALLLLNRDEGNAAEFVANYRERRDAGSDPAEAVEYALAGLRDPDEIRRVRRTSEHLDLPIAITTALMRRRDDGPEVYRTLLSDLAGRGMDSDTMRSVAGILAVSLEPAQALRRWLDARAALGNLGLEGAYADVAAAFGASDRRGPRAFALAYAAQRQALARSDIDDADRFAPELAHEGTSRQTDSWTGEPIPSSYGWFDPFTFFYFHWVITRGSSGSFGWEPVYRDSSWSGDRNSWWGGFGGGGGFGGAGSSWGGSSWGSSGGGFSFGGFGGGGGFSGGGGGGSGW